jgi:hypothetical protein
VTLLHDAMIDMERSPSGNATTAFFPSGNWEYKSAERLARRPRSSTHEQ